MALLAWVVGGLLTLFAGLTIAEVAARIPRTGGVYAYIDEIYGEKAGFMCGWVITLLYCPGLKGALSLYFASLAQPILGFEDKFIVPFAILALLFLTVLNIVSTKASGYFSTLTTFIKLIPIVVISVLGLSSGVENPFQNLPQGTEGVAINFGAAVLSTLWAYDGWMMVGNVAGEMKHPVRDLPRAIMIGLGIVLLAYLGVNLALFKTLPIDQIAALGAKASQSAAVQLLGVSGGVMVSLGILISIYGCLNSDMLSGSRVPYAMASKRDLQSIRFLHKVHPKFGTPVNAIVLQVAAAIVMILVANPDQITDFAMFSVYAFYGLAIAGVFVLRRKNPNPGEGIYKVALYPVVPLLAILGTAYILVSTVLDQPSMALIALGITLLGLPAYYYIRRQPQVIIQSS
jgi:APA family basic amino acid/polyamine antiporter